MVPTAQTKTEARQPVEQKQPAGMLPPTMPPAARAPAPPRGAIAARVQRMPLAGRWALGLVLAFLSGAGSVWSQFGLNYALTRDSFLLVLLGITLVAVLALAMAAGFVLGSWWATLVLAVTTTAGVFVGTWGLDQIVYAGEPEQLRAINTVLDDSIQFSKFYLAPLIVFLLAGVGLGKLRGMSLGRPHVLPAGEAMVSRWIAALGPASVGGFFAAIAAADYTPFGVWSLRDLGGRIFVLALAATCMLAGWLLRSWWGLVVVPLVYVGAAYAGIAALAADTLGGSVDFSAVFTREFALYIVPAAVAMSVIGTAIGVFTARHGGRPQLRTAA